jgi:hypothetical protein
LCAVTHKQLDFESHTVKLSQTVQVLMPSAPLPRGLFMEAAEVAGNARHLGPPGIGCTEHRSTPWTRSAGYASVA